MSDQADLKSQRDAFKFLREHFREDGAFTKASLAQETGWSSVSVSTYWSKQFAPFVQPIPPLLKGADRKDQKYRVTDVFLTVGTWPKFRRHVSQKRRLTFDYTHTVSEAVLIFEFFLPLTNETVLRNALDALFYRNTSVTG